MATQKQVGVERAGAGVEPPRFSFSEPPVPDCPVAPQSCGFRWRIASIVNSPEGGLDLVGQKVTVGGWIRTLRKQGASNFCFVVLNDGSSVSCLQAVVSKSVRDYERLLKCKTGSSVKMTGELRKQPEGCLQAVELALSLPDEHFFSILGEADAQTYPLSKKHHGKEYLREIAHLRPRSLLIGAVTRIRSQLSMATHRFFQDRGFLYVHTPIITSSDCEGAGELFRVTTILGETVDAIPRVAHREQLVDAKKDFFGKPAFLTCSGQLNVETFCCGMGDVYTFGPTFRAENSNTSRHLAEFWMIEPEMAFADIFDDMNLAEEYLKYCIRWCLAKLSPDVDWLDSKFAQGLRANLEKILTATFERITYTKAIEILEPHKANFVVPPEWGVPLGAEHETFLTERVFDKPVIVYNYPKDFKAFYMKLNDDKKTVAAMDVLLPKIGEIIGGSQREHDKDKLVTMIREKNLPESSYEWYIDLRKYGTIPHSGFGLGFERLVMLVSGMENIRDVIPFPRYPQHANF